MTICIPVAQDNGLQSPVYGHFGSAPFLAIYDQEKAEVQVVPNSNHRHDHGACHPTAALSQHEVKALITGGIGRRATALINKAGIKVYQAGEGHSCSEIIDLFQKNQLKELTPADACGGHGHHGQGSCHEQSVPAN